MTVALGCVSVWVYNVVSIHRLQLRTLISPLLFCITATIIMIAMFIKARKKYSYPVLKNKPVDPVSKQVLLVFMCLMFGVEIGYKICSGRVLYLLNPCHVITMVEVSVPHNGL